MIVLFLRLILSLLLLFSVFFIIGAGVFAFHELVKEAYLE